VPSLTVAQLKVVAELLQPVGNELKPDVMARVLAGYPSSVANVTVTGVLVPVIAATELWLGVPTMVSLLIARYGMATEPVFI
jgi:hypothetical protein